MSLIEKKIIVGLTGGIACYKAAELVRLLRQQGAEIQVAMTTSAQQFITPMTMQALSGRPVRDTLFSAEAENAMSHIELARWADMVVMAPATANSIAKLAHGIADDLLTTLCLAAQGAVIVAPAMNVNMWQHPSTERNIQILRENGVMVWGPATGEQACGDVGLGRLLEPIELVQRIQNYFLPKALSGKRILITAGPTREALDPVRYFSNYSSGKMGYALAEAAKHLGAEVILISGPTALAPIEKVKCRFVESACEMHRAVFENLAGVDIFIAAAAVADFRPKNFQENKIKKSKDNMSVEFVPNPDILDEVSHAKDRPGCVVGFAAESERLKEHALLKLRKKNLDFIVANDISHGKVFSQEDNEILLLDREGNVVFSGKNTKRQLAMEILMHFAKVVDYIPNPGEF